MGSVSYRRLLLGSATAKVLHHPECPIWTDAYSEQATPGENFVPRSTLRNRFGGSKRAPMFLTSAYQAELRIVHAIPAMSPPFPVQYLDAEFATSTAVEARRRIATLQTGFATEASVAIEAGEPAKVVPDIGREFAADLFVVPCDPSLNGLCLN
jgi:nucleotide-binding universal stress UspA family protein